jgi:hypothetical protein
MAPMSHPYASDDKLKARRNNDIWKPREFRHMLACRDTSQTACHADAAIHELVRELKEDNWIWMDEVCGGSTKAAAEGMAADIIRELYSLGLKAANLDVMIRAGLTVDDIINGCGDMDGAVRGGHTACNDIWKAHDLCHMLACRNTSQTDRPAKRCRMEGDLGAVRIKELFKSRT